ncbi:MAG: hypothetical protein A2X49_14065 [Lentisphaerae bacterium GWF2_52_8]|nr:MAG: hypothetical protein A2X49_14065 [Lentisphaerae bacterium GWF2_52_8]
MFKIKSITKANLLSWITTILLISAVFTAFFIYQKLNDFDRNIETLQKSYTSYKQEILANEVNNVIRYLNYQYLHAKEAGTEASPGTKKAAIEALREIKFGRQSKGNIFIIDRTGTILLHPDPNLIGKSFAEVSTSTGSPSLNKLIDAARIPNGGYAQYELIKTPAGAPVPILSFVQAFPRWEWMVCSELSKGDIIRATAANEARLRINLAMEIAFICLLAAIVTLVAVIFSFMFSQMVKKELDILIAFFRDSAVGNSDMKEEDLQFSEFKFIGVSAIAMVNKIKLLVEKVKQLAIKAEISSQAKSCFLANMSHEIRMPLNGVMGMSQMLLDTKLDATQKDYVDSLRISGQALVNLVDGIRDFSASETGEVEINRKPFELSKLFSEVKDLMSKRAADKNLSLEFKPLPEGLPAWMLGDSGRIRQVLNALVNNGIIFTKEGSVTVDLEAKERNGDKFTLQFRVVDTGLGISKEKQDFIFDFTYHDIATSRKFGAVSLGLAVCKSLVESMGGKIGMSSEKWQGSTFFFTVTLEAAQAPVSIAVPDASSAVSSEKKIARSIKTLLVEDDIVNQRVAVNFLSRAGAASVDVAANGVDAVKKFKSGSYDIIFMDCEMPEMDGYAATREIRKLELAGKGGHTPIIAMTANALQGDKELCLSAGMDDHTPKPVTPETLRELLGKHLGV